MARSTAHYRDVLGSTVTMSPAGAERTWSVWLTMSAREAKAEVAFERPEVRF